MSETPPSNTERVPADFLPLYPAPLQLAIGAVALYVIVAVAIHLPSLEGIATQLIGGEGALRALQMLDSHTRGIGAHAWFTTHYGYPWGDAFTWGDNVLIPSLIATALRTLGISLGAIFNLLLITASLLNGYCAFRLVYQLTGSGYVSVVGGLSFLLGPPYLLLDYDPTLQASFILPVVISAALRFVGMPTLRHGALLGLLLSAALLISLDLAVVGGIAALLILASIALIHPLPNILHLYRSAFGGLALGLLASVPILWAYRGARQVLAPLALTELGNRSATVSSFVPAINFECLFDAKGLFLLFPGISGTVIACGAVLALLRLTDTRHLRIILALWGIALLGVALEPPPQHVLAPLFAGIVIVSALALLHRLGRLEHQLNVRIVTNRDLIAVFVLLGSFFFLYSLASPSAAVSPNGIFSSIAFILGALPFSQPIAGVIAVGLTVTVLASFTLVRLLRRSSRRLFIALLLGTLLTVERFPFCGIPHEPLPLARNTERALKLAAPAGAIAIALPLSEVPHIPSGSPNPALSSLQLPLITLINPTTPRTPEFFKELAHETADFPSARAIRSLSRIAGLRYILVHEASPIGRLGGSLMERAERFGDDIRYIESDGDGRYLFELIAATRITGDTVILAPAHSRGVLQLELKALYEPEEPHIPLTIRWRTKETSAVLSEATVTANGEWGEFSFPLPVRRSSPEPLEITFETPPQARVWFRRAGFTPF